MIDSRITSMKRGSLSHSATGGKERAFTVGSRSGTAKPSRIKTGRSNSGISRAASSTRGMTREGTVPRIQSSTSSSSLTTDNSGKADRNPVSQHPDTWVGLPPPLRKSSKTLSRTPISINDDVDIRPMRKATTRIADPEISFVDPIREPEYASIFPTSSPESPHYELEATVGKAPTYHDPVRDAQPPLRKASTSVSTLPRRKSTGRTLSYKLGGGSISRVPSVPPRAPISTTVNDEDYSTMSSDSSLTPMLPLPPPAQVLDAIMDSMLDHKMTLHDIAHDIHQGIADLDDTKDLVLLLHEAAQLAPKEHFSDFSPTDPKEHRTNSINQRSLTDISTPLMRQGTVMREPSQLGDEPSFPPQLISRGNTIVTRRARSDSETPRAAGRRESNSSRKSFAFDNRPRMPSATSLDTPGPLSARRELSISNGEPDSNREADIMRQPTFSREHESPTLAYADKDIIPTNPEDDKTRGSRTGQEPKLREPPDNTRKIAFRDDNRVARLRKEIERQENTQLKRDAASRRGHWWNQYGYGNPTSRARDKPNAWLGINQPDFQPRTKRSGGTFLGKSYGGSAGKPPSEETYTEMYRQEMQYPKQDYASGSAVKPTQGVSKETNKLKGPQWEPGSHRAVAEGTSRLQGRKGYGMMPKSRGWGGVWGWRT